MLSPLGATTLFVLLPASGRSLSVSAAVASGLLSLSLLSVLPPVEQAKHPLLQARKWRR